MASLETCSTPKPPRSTISTRWPRPEEGCSLETQSPAGNSLDSPSQAGRSLRGEESNPGAPADQRRRGEGPPQPRCPQPQEGRRWVYYVGHRTVHTWAPTNLKPGGQNFGQQTGGPCKLIQGGGGKKHSMVGKGFGNIVFLAKFLEKLWKQQKIFFFSFTSNSLNFLSF